MRLAILCDSYSLGGLELNILRLNRWLNEAGERSVLLCPEGSALHHQAKDLQLPHTAYPASSPKRRYLNIKLLRFVSAYLAKHRIAHLLLSNSHELHVAAWLKAGSLPLKTAYLQQMKFDRLKRGLAHRVIHRMLDAWIAPLPYLKEQVLAKTTISASKIYEIPLCIEIAPFAKASKLRDEARRDLDLAAEDLIIGLVGRLHPSKGYHLLINALPKLVSLFPNLKVVIVGDRSAEGMSRDIAYKKELLALADELTVRKHLHFRPFLDQPAMAFAALDCFVMASTQETFGMVTIESMATGTPVVGANCFGTGQLVKDGVNGYLFDSENTESLIDSIQKVLKSKEELKKIRLQAQEYVSLHYQHDRMVKGIVELFQII